MNPRLKLIAQIFIAFVAIFFLSQPYNWFCALTQNCRPFHFSYYLPKIEGKTELRTILEVQNYKENVEFYSDVKEITTVSGRKNSVNFTIKNNSKKPVLIRPKMIVEPEGVEDFITCYQCPQSSSFLLKPKKELNLKMEFAIDSALEKSDLMKYGEEEIIIRIKI